MPKLCPIKAQTPIHCVYLIRNTVNGKVYVGQTNMGLERRWRAHVNASNKKGRVYFWSAIRFHGQGSFVMEPLVDDLTKEEANRLEREYIVKFQSHKRSFGYNSTLGGEGGQVQNEEVRQRMSLAKKGKPAAWMSGPNREAILQKIRESKLGPKNPNYRGAAPPRLKRERAIRSGSIKRRTKEEMRVFHSARNSGSGNPMYGRSGSKSPNFGKPRTVAFKEKMYAKAEARISSFEVADLYRYGYSTVQIASMYDTHPTTINKRLKKRGVAMRLPGRHTRA